MSATRWTLRVCPVCGCAKVDDGYTVCEGPSCGPFPSDASHKPTVTDALVVGEAEPLEWARDAAMTSAAKWRSAYDYLAARLDLDDPDTNAVLDAAEASREAPASEAAREAHRGAPQ